jgi:hypothetical protein
MRNLIFITIFSAFVITSSYAQKTINPKEKFSIGIGYGFNSNIGNDGIVFSNDYKHSLTDKLVINPGISFFQSINFFQDMAENGYKSHSGLVFDLSLEYSVYRKNNFNIALNLGPSFEIGDLSYSSIRTYMDGVLIEERFVHDQVYEPGVFGSIEFSWDKDRKLVKTLAITTNSQFGLIPNSLGIVYKIGF